MAMIFGGFALIALIDMVPIIRQRSWRILIVFLLFFASALTLAILQQIGVDVQSSVILILRLFRKLNLGYKSV